MELGEPGAIAFHLLALAGATSRSASIIPSINTVRLSAVFLRNRVVMLPLSFGSGTRQLYGTPAPAGGNLATMAATQQAAWRPDDETIRNANLTAVMRELGVHTYPDLHRWSIDDRPAFWHLVLDRLGIVFHVPPDQILVGTPREPTWLPGARMNIVDSCFTARSTRPPSCTGGRDRIDACHMAICEALSIDSRRG